MKKYFACTAAAVLFVVMLLCGAAYAEEAEKKNDAAAETRKGQMSFSAGFQVHYSWWEPNWSRIDSSPFASALIQRWWNSTYGVQVYWPNIRFNTKPNWLYNPVFIWTINRRVSLSGNFLFTADRFRYETDFRYGRVDEMLLSHDLFAKAWIRASKYDADLLLNISLHRNFRVFLGPKYQGYVISDKTVYGINMGGFGGTKYAVYDKTHRMHTFGWGVGGALHLPLYGSLHLVTSVSGIFLYGRNFSSDTYGPSSAVALGGSGSGSLAYYIKPITTTLALGIRGQYLYFVRTANRKKNDLFWGPFASFLYRF